MADIPFEIYGKIFLLLPAKSLIRFRAVCKSWRHVIDDPSFVKAHTNKQHASNTILIRNSTGPPFHPLYSIDLETVNFTNGLQTVTATPLNFTVSGLSCRPLSRRFNALPVATCNGLMLVENEENPEIWNPLTNERLELPKRNWTSKCVSCGLGYDYATDDYKVVVMDPLGLNHANKYVNETHIYSLKLDSWRNIIDFPCAEYSLESLKPCVFLNGALHWLSSGNKRDTIIAFDLGTETYRKLRMPPCPEGVFRRQNHLYVLDGFLFLSDYESEKPFDVWVMKDYGAQDSWIKLFSLQRQSICGHLDTLSLRLVAYMRNKMQIFMQTFSGFNLYDVANNSVKDVSIHGLSGGLSAQIFHGSIFRLHDNCGVSGSEKTRMRKRKVNKMMMKMADTELMFCVRDLSSQYESHDSCCSIDSN